MTSRRPAIAIIALMLIVAAIALVVGCGRNPTAPLPCTADRATQIDTVWYVLPDTTKVAGILYVCRS